MAKLYYLSDLSKIQSVAMEMGLRYWRVENIQKDELIKINPTIKASEALEKIFKYLASELVSDGKYFLIGKTGQKSIPTTMLTLIKGEGEPSANNAYNTTLAYKDYNDVIQDNAKLKAENYYFSEQIKVLHEQIAELREELENTEDEEEETGKASLYQEMAKEYAPQLLQLVTNYFGPKSNPIVTSFSDAPPPSAPPPQKIIRFSPEYEKFWRQCTDQNAVNLEFQHLQVNKPERLEYFTNLFNGKQTN